MNKIQLYALILNFITYIIMILPYIFFAFKKSIYKNKKTFLNYLTFSIFIGFFSGIILHIFSRNIFSLFTDTSGIINYAVYSSKILFICSSLFSINILIPTYFWRNEKQHKKTAILFLSKIAVHILFIFIGFILFDIKGILYSLPLCDLIYCIIYIALFLKVFC